MIGPGSVGALQSGGDSAQLVQRASVGCLYRHSQSTALGRPYGPRHEKALDLIWQPLLARGRHLLARLDLVRRLRDLTHAFDRRHIAVSIIDARHPVRLGVRRPRVRRRRRFVDESTLMRIVRRLLASYLALEN